MKIVKEIGPGVTGMELVKVGAWCLLCYAKLFYDFFYVPFSSLSITPFFIPHDPCSLQDMKNTSNNRGFAFIDYHNHACAEYSRQKMMNPKFKLADNAPTVSWADPKNAESSAASQVYIT